MGLVWADRVRDTTTTTGTGPVAVSGTAPTAYRTFSAVCSVGDTFYGFIAHRDANEWEVGLYTYSAPNEVTRTTVLASSNGGSAVNFSSGTKDVMLDVAADRVSHLLATKTANYVLAGPTSGGAAVASFRALVAADIPDLSSVYQPLDADLTAIAALSTAAYGRSLLTLANATALAAEVDSFFLTPTEGNAAYQPLDSDLTAIAALSTTAYGRSLLTLADAAALASAVDHGGLSGLSDDDHTQYALLAGRSGGQTIIGGTAANNDLTVRPTSHATGGTFVVKASSSQSDALQEWQNSSAAVLASLSADCSTLVLPRPFAIGGGTHGTLATQQTLIGYGSNGNGNTYATLVGDSASATGSEASVFGVNATAAARGTALGVGATATADSVAIGRNTVTTVAGTTLVGTGLTSSASGAVFGRNNTITTATAGVYAFGVNNSLTADYSLAFAHQGTSTHTMSLMLGVFPETTATGQMVWSTSGVNPSLVFMRDSSTAQRPVAQIRSLWQTSTDASRAGDLVLEPYYTTTAQEGVRVRGASGGVQLGFFAATPVAQQAGDVRTALDNLGLTSSATYALAGIVQGRLTTESGVAVSTSDRTSQGTLYFTPYNGNLLSLYDGSVWKLYTFTERSLALSVTSGTNYDIYIYDNSGTLTLEAVAWTNDTTRATALALTDGVPLKTGALTRLYLGTIRASGSNVTEDSEAKRYVWNHWNRVPRQLRAIEATNTWSYTTDTVRQANGAAANKVEYVTGDAASFVDARVAAVVYLVSNSANAAKAGVGIDSTAAFSGLVQGGYNQAATGVYSPIGGEYRGRPGLGYHYLAWLEKGADGTSTFVGDNNGDGQQCGIYATLLG